jgi:hypothetical protein
MKFAVGLTFAAALLATVAQAKTTAAQAQTNVKIGMLTDMSSLYADDNGAGSIAAAKLVTD